MKKQMSLSSVQALEKFNTIAMIAEGAIFWAAFSFVDTNSVISVFMDREAGSSILAGLALTVMYLSPIFGTFLLGRFIHQLRSPHKSMVIISLLTRPAMLLMVPLLMSGVKGYGAAISFLALYALLYFGDGFVGLLWTEIHVRTISPHRRGMVCSYQRIIAGGVGLIAGSIIRSVLTSPLTDTQQFSILFGVSGAISLLDVFVLWLMKDSPEYQPRTEVPIPGFRQYIRQFIPLFRQSAVFRKITSLRWLHLLGMMCAPLNILFASQCGMPTEQLTLLVYMPVIGTTLGGLFWGKISMKKGYIHVIKVSQLINLVAAVLCLFSVIIHSAGASVFFPIALSMMLLNANTNAFIGYSNHLINSVDKSQIALYLVLLSLCIAPVTFGSTIAGALVGIIGYPLVYISVLSLSLVGTVLSFLFFRKSADDHGDKIKSAA